MFSCVVGLGAGGGSDACDCLKVSGEGVALGAIVVEEGVVIVVEDEGITKSLLLRAESGS